MDQTINVNITPGQFRPSLHYSQGDVGRVFKIQVVDFDIPAGSTVQCVATKPSGLGFTLAGTVSGNEITFVTTDAVTDEWGRFPAEVKIINGGNVIGTANFLMIGEKNPHPDTTIDGKQEEFIPLLTLLVERIEAAAEDVDAQVPVVQQAADDAAASASEASDSADSAADSATAASGSANEASNSAIAAAASAASAAESADAAVDTFLGDTYIEDTSPYIFRQTGDGASGVGRREKLKSIVGATVAWNQLYNLPSSQTANGITMNFEDGVISLSGTATVGYAQFFSTKITGGHKILVSTRLISNPNNLSFRFGSLNGQGNALAGSSSITNAVTIADNTGIGVEAFGGTGAIFDGIKLQAFCIDLTQLFGSTIADYIYQLEQTTAGAGVAWFKRYFPKSYYPYDAGSIVSVKTPKHITRGFNAWDEEWEVGTYSTTTGEKVASTTQIRSKNYISVLPNMAYYITANPYAWVMFFDADKNLITADNLPSGTKSNNALAWGNGIKTTPTNCHYIVFYEQATYGVSYKNDICINLHLDGERDGEYEAYKANEYALDPDLELRGLPILDDQNNLSFANGDIYQSDGTVTRKWGIATFDGKQGAWSPYEGAFYKDFTGYRKSQNSILAIGDTAFSFPQNNGIVGLISAGRGKFSFRCDQDTIQLYPTDDSVITSSQLNAYLANKPLTIVYELDTPTTEEADPYTELQICDPLGTEEFVTDGIVPVGNVTQYPEDLKAKLEGLPWNFSTLIAPTEATSTASRAYAIGDYLILNNVLYKVTAAISSGGTITVGTNVVATTVTDEIKALRS